MISKRKITDSSVPAVDSNWEVERGDDSADAEGIPDFFKLVVSSLRWNLRAMSLAGHRSSVLTDMNVLQNFALCKKIKENFWIKSLP
jgi:hypothetical protein